MTSKQQRVSRKTGLWVLCCALTLSESWFTQRVNAFAPPNFPSSTSHSATFPNIPESERRSRKRGVTRQFQRIKNEGLRAIPGLESFSEITAASSSFSISMSPAITSLVSLSPAFSSLGSFVTNIAESGGPPVMALAVAISDSVPLLPTQPIAIVAGALFGFQKGLLAVVLGQTLATVFALVIGRQLGSNILDILGRENSEKVRKVLEQLGLDSTADYKKVFTTMLVARQSPVLPFSVGNYMVGAATSAPILPALLGTIIGCLPLNCVWVGAGSGGMSALDFLSEEGGGVGFDSPYLSTLETIGVLATALIVANLVKVVWSVWNEDAAPDSNNDTELVRGKKQA